MPERPPQLDIVDLPDPSSKSSARPSQVKVNLRAWFPDFAGRVWHQRLVRYPARENREGGAWGVELARACATCGATEGLKPVRESRQVRSFNHPVAPLVLVAIAVLLLVLLSLIWPWSLLWALVVPALGAGWLFLHSTSEQVRIAYFACARHREDSCPLEVAIHDNELCLVAPVSSVAESTRAEQTSRRRGKGGRTVQTDDPSTPVASESGRPAEAVESDDAASLGIPTRRPRGEALPPIKLDD